MCEGLGKRPASREGRGGGRRDIPRPFPGALESPSSCPEALVSGSLGRGPGSAQAWGFYSPRGKQRAAATFTARSGTLGSPSENPFPSCVTDSSGWSLRLGTGKARGQGGASERWPRGANAVRPLVLASSLWCSLIRQEQRTTAQSEGNVLSFVFSFCDVFFLNLWCCPRTSLSLTWCPVQWAPHSRMWGGEGAGWTWGQGLRGRSPGVAAHFPQEPMSRRPERVQIGTCRREVRLLGSSRPSCFFDLTVRLSWL